MIRGGGAPVPFPILPSRHGLGWAENPSILGMLWLARPMLRPSRRQRATGFSTGARVGFVDDVEHVLLRLALRFRSAHPTNRTLCGRCRASQPMMAKIASATAKPVNTFCSMDHFMGGY